MQGNSSVIIGDMENFAAALKTMGHVDRLRILALLARGELTITELVQILGLSQPRVTQYIKSLESVEIIERLREGSWVFSRLKRGNPALTKLVETTLQTLPQNEALLLSDMRRLNEVRDARSRVADAFFARVAQNSDQLGDEYLPQERIEDALLKISGDGPFDFMIDMGTGTGRMLELFSGRITRGAGIDSNPDMLKVARHKLAPDQFGHISVQQGDLHATPFRENTADLVTLHQVLHYLDDPREAIYEASRLLTRDGQLLIVDFEAHTEDHFREDYAHRRLGFTDLDITEWAKWADLQIKIETKLSNNNNPAIKIWKAVKP
ncbi:ArsR family transcriptional regulator [Litorimonas haliclonae]